MDDAQKYSKKHAINTEFFYNKLRHEEGYKTSGPEASRAGIFKKSMGARNRGGIGLSYRPARLHRLAEFIPWNQFRGPINI
jgi:hypothetical protein